MSKVYMGVRPAGHKEADMAATAWGEEIAGRVAKERRGLARSALFALFRLSAEERVTVFEVFCKECGDHKEGFCHCWNDE